MHAHVQSGSFLICYGRSELGQQQPKAHFGILARRAEVTDSDNLLLTGGYREKWRYGQQQIRVIEIIATIGGLCPCTGIDLDGKILGTRVRHTKLDRLGRRSDVDANGIDVQGRSGRNTERSERQGGKSHRPEARLAEDRKNLRRRS